MAEPKESARRRSDPGLDVYRGLAVVLMFLAHVWRVQEHRGLPPEGIIAWLDRTIAWMDGAVAYVAASFLFVAGFSLVLAHRTAAKVGSSKWAWGVLRRAGWLYALSFVMFLPEHGFEFPDIVASSGILSVIAVALALTAGALMVPRQNFALCALAGSILGGTYALERWHLEVSGLNAGPGGAIPLVMFAALGALCGRVYLARGVTWVFVFAAIASPVFAVALVLDDPWLAFCSSIYTNHGGLAVADWLGMTSGSGTLHLRFWNPSALGALGLIAPVALTAGLHLAFQKQVANHILVRPLLLLGRHALLCFVGHYALLGLVDLAGLRPPHAAWTLLLLLMLTVTCVALSAALDSWQRRRRAPG